MTEDNVPWDVKGKLENNTIKKVWVIIQETEKHLENSWLTETVEKLSKARRTGSISQEMYEEKIAETCDPVLGNDIASSNHKGDLSTSDLDGKEE